MNPRTIKVLLLIILVITSMACASSAPAEPNTPHQIQEWVEVAEYDIYVYEIIDNPEINDGKRWIYIEVGYENNRSNEELSCRDGQWILYDSEGYSYEPEWMGGVYDQHNLRELGSERFLNKGTNLRGWIMFEIPEDAVLERLQFFTGYLSTNTADFIIP